MIVITSHPINTNWLLNDDCAALIAIDYRGAKFDLVKSDNTVELNVPLLSLNEIVKNIQEKATSKAIAEEECECVPGHVCSSCCEYYAKFTANDPIPF